MVLPCLTEAELDLAALRHIIPKRAQGSLPLIQECALSLSIKAQGSLN